MAGGLAALLDDVAVIAKLTSSAAGKAAGVVVDDTAVTPRYVHGFSPARELPIIWKIAVGSLRNKLIFILPVALLLSQFVPWLLTPILMLGGTYLSFEGAEKIWEAVSGHGKGEDAQPVIEQGPEHEKKMVRGAITTDFILSAEIMVISLNQVANQPFWPRAITLVVVAIFITALVYGVVALIVKMDDIGLHLTERESSGAQRMGRFLVAAMPKVLSFLSTVGIAAMLWVGGHILLVGAKDLGWKTPYNLVHHLEEPVAYVAVLGPFLGWLVNTICSAIIGLLVGAVVVLVMHLLPFGKKGHGKEHGAEHEVGHGDGTGHGDARTADRPTGSHPADGGDAQGH
ncbi:DUF808 domain-containing protein [Naumannella sp. ID2617S]|nr:DUF808 domain-containing protein [Naumannella sp. ID2617S]